MRYLGIDYGSRRIGLALSDSDGRIAFPHATVGRPEEVADVIRHGAISGIVIGLLASARVTMQFIRQARDLDQRDVDRHE